MKVGLHTCLRGLIYHSGEQFSLTQCQYCWGLARPPLKEVKLPFNRHMEEQSSVPLWYRRLANLIFDRKTEAVLSIPV